MGAAISNQVANQVINSSYSIANSYIDKCKSTTLNDFTLEAEKGCVKQSTGPIDLTNNTSINVSCVQNSSTRSSMQTQISTQILDQATAAAQSIGGPSLSFADQIQNFSQNASTSIMNNYTQDCLSSVDNNVTIKCASGATQTIGAIDVSSNTNEFTSCIAKNRTDSDLVGTLSTIIQNSTNASEADTFGVVIVVILIFLAIGAIFFIYTLNGPTGWLIVIIVLSVVIGLSIYSAFAFNSGLFPFNGGS